MEIKKVAKKLKINLSYLYMEFTNLKFKEIKEEEFLSYLDWLTRFKNPVNNLLRVSEKIITKNCLSYIKTKLSDYMKGYSVEEIIYPLNPAREDIQNISKI